MARAKSNVWYWIFKIVSVLVSLAFPGWAIYERFPIWISTHGTTRSIGTGGILMILVVLFICRRPVFSFLKDRLKMKYAPSPLGWGVLLALSYILVFVSRFLNDIVVVFWMGLFGSAIGAFLTFVAENFLRVEKKENG